jgi:hypothetical protein
MMSKLLLLVDHAILLLILIDSQLLQVENESRKSCKGWADSPS